VIDPRDATLLPLYFVLLRLEAGLVSRIRDFRYARYANDVIDQATMSAAWRAAPSA
jgi:hypothetical protein